MGKGAGGDGGARGVGGAAGRSAAPSLATLVNAIGVGNFSMWDQGMRDMSLHRAGYKGATRRQATAIASGRRDVMNISQMPLSRRFRPVSLSLSFHRSGRVETNVTDGRHRITAAREAGASRILARVRVYRETRSGDWRETADRTGVFKMAGRGPARRRRR